MICTSSSLELMNVGFRMFVARGFSNNALWPIILICQFRDYSYCMIHFNFKAGF